MELERVFGAPVVEAYGMTEASHQICSNPLPPGIRKAGSVGVATGCEVAVVDDVGTPLGPGEIGEVVIRGPNVTAGYECGPRDRPAPFTDGWLRTGDQGMLDADGYLFIKGRLKELINRGGTKIAPREIEEVLLAHPGVTQVAVFGVPHSTLGENVAAAVVLRHDADAAEAALRRFVAERLADFKVPCRVLIVDEIPKGPTGKLHRARLAEQFGPLLMRPEHIGPATPQEYQLQQLWETILGVRPVGLRDNFFDLGGDSLTAMRILNQVERTWGTRLPLAAFLEEATVEHLARLLWRSAPASSTPPVPGGPRPMIPHAGPANAPRTFQLPEGEQAIPERVAQQAAEQPDRIAVETTRVRG